MSHFFCIAIGMLDFTPDVQEYHRAETETEFREIVDAARMQFIADIPEPDETRGNEFYSYELWMPRDGENNYSQRLMVEASSDRVLDIIGMTEDEFDRESAE